MNGENITQKVRDAPRKWGFLIYNIIMNNNNEFENNIEQSDKLPFTSTRVNDFEELEYIVSIGDSELIEMEDCTLLTKNGYITSYSYNANPCVSGIVQTKNDDIYMFHSTGYGLSSEQEKILKNSKRGIAGGGIEAIGHLSLILKEANIEIIPSPGNDYDFNIVFVKERNIFNVKPGLYYCYAEELKFDDSNKPNINEDID